MNELLYQPHLNQAKIHRCQARYRTVVAGRRFGKTALGLNEAIYRILQVPRQLVWIILPQLKQAREVYWIDPDVTRYFLPLVQKGILKKNDTDLSLYCKKTESWIRLKGSDNPDSLRGSGLDLIIWDEVKDIKTEAFDIIKPSLADSPYHRQLFIGTPGGLDHLHDLALMGNHDGSIPTFEKPVNLDPDYQTFHYTSYDNLSWPIGSYAQEQFTTYINKERAKAEESGKLSFFMQEYMASFEESGGRFFPKWSFATHVINKEVDVSYVKQIIGSFDWGRQAPMAWYAHAVIPMDLEGLKFNRIVTFKEVYNAGPAPAEHAKAICKQIDYNKVEKTYMDPSMADKLGDGSIGIGEQFRKAFKELIGDIPLLLKALNKRPPRWAILDNWMLLAPDGLPYWMITKNCVNLIRTLPLMKPDKNNIEDIDTTLEDHAVDSVSYAIQYIEWIEAKFGGIHRPTKTVTIARTLQAPTLINADKFATIKRRHARDWRAI